MLEALVILPAHLGHLKTRPRTAPVQIGTTPAAPARVSFLDRVITTRTRSLRTRWMSGTKG